jgi:hypothetical protein
MFAAALLVMTSPQMVVAIGGHDGVYVITGERAFPVIVHAEPVWSVAFDAKGNAVATTKLEYTKSVNVKSLMPLDNLAGQVFVKRSTAYWVAAERTRAYGKQIMEAGLNLYEAALMCDCAYCGCTNAQPGPCVCKESRCKANGCLCDNWKKK